MVTPCLIQALATGKYVHEGLVRILYQALLANIVSWDLYMYIV